MDLDILKNISLFQALSREALETLHRESLIKEYSPGSVIFREGDTSDHLYVVLEGQIEIIKSMGSEVERLIRVLTQSDIMGEMSVVSLERTRSASAATSTGARVMEIPVRSFEALVRQNAALSFEMMQMVLQRIRETENIAIQDLKETNRQLAQSLEELKEAQEKIIAKEKMEQELATARKIQESMLPESVPTLPGWELAAYWQPARAVSGDFYDFIALPDKRMAIVIGDVTDKGVPAALIMTVTRSMLRAAAMTTPTPGELLERVNNLLCPEIPLGMFVTCHVSYLDPISGRLEYANAGHCRPLLRRNDEITELHAKGLALGIYPDYLYENKSVALQPGDLLLYFSDGLNEAHNSRQEMLGTEAVRAFLRKTGTNTVAAFVEFLKRFVDPTQDPEDDITLLSLQYLTAVHASTTG